MGCEVEGFGEMRMKGKCVSGRGCNRMRVEGIREDRAVRKRGQGEMWREGRAFRMKGLWVRG